MDKKSKMKQVTETMLVLVEIIEKDLGDESEMSDLHNSMTSIELIESALQAYKDLSERGRS